MKNSRLFLLLISVPAVAVPNNLALHESGINNANLTVIQPHTRSAELNAKHAAECAEQGGVDVTDEGLVQIGSGVTDIRVCKITHDIKQPPSSAHGVQGIYAITDLIPPMGTVHYSPFTFDGVATFHSDRSGSDNFLIRTSPGLPSCISSYARKIDANTDFKFTYRVTCLGGTVGKTQSSVLGCKATSDTSSASCLSPSAESFGTMNFIQNPDAISINKNLGIQQNSWSCNTPSSLVSNPINLAIGNKFQQEQDIQGFGACPLSFIRYYNSKNEGGLWTHNYSAHLIFNQEDSATKIALINNDGREADFLMNGNTITQFPSELGTLKKNGANFEYTTPFNEKYFFDSNGILFRTISNNGLIHNINHSANNQLVVTDSFGNSLTIIETKNHQPFTVKTGSGIEMDYFYDHLDRLIKVTHNGKVKIYHYEDSRFPHALTGITNENGVRYITWTYDSSGRANSGSNYGGTNKVQITYNSDTQAVVTNPLGRKSTYTYFEHAFDGVNKLKAISSEKTSLCQDANKTFGYNLENGELASSFNGMTGFQYFYNDLKQEVMRIQDYFPDGDYIQTKTTWDSRFNLPKTITYSNRTVSYDYDSRGNVTHINIKPNN